MSHAHPPAPTFARQIAYTLVTLGAMILAFVVYTTSEKAIDAANEARLRTFLLADELHQSSDDLTRMARLYVVSEHPHARQYHQRILDIREGLQARPDSTQRISLVELMRQAQAVQMLHDATYLAAKAAILAPIDRANTLMRSARTAPWHGPNNARCWPVRC